MVELNSQKFRTTILISLYIKDWSNWRLNNDKMLNRFVKTKYKVIFRSTMFRNRYSLKLIRKRHSLDSSTRRTFEINYRNIRNVRELITNSVSHKLISARCHINPGPPSDADKLHLRPRFMGINSFFCGMAYEIRPLKPARLQRT